MYYKKGLMESYRQNKEKTEKELGIALNDDDKAKQILKKISENRRKKKEKYNEILVNFNLR